ncbi:MAG: outer membrane beta-barrel protein [Ignavibacteriales bacterium]|nr:outer membrane beta-barrel protein [Ignavibacteriales bacterium]
MTTKRYYSLISILFLSLSFIIPSISQDIKRIQPEWWFGGALGINFNFHSSNFNTLNSTAPLPVSFTDGSGICLYFAPMIEYRPHPVWGGMFAFGFDGRRGTFDDVRDTSTTYLLSTSMNYLSLEPSVRISPFEFPLYFFAGPRLSFNVAKSFTLKRTSQPDTEGDFINTRGTTIGGQIGAGYEFALTNPEKEWQINASPFLSLNFGQGPRSDVDWSLTTLRAGIAVKFGNTTEIISKVMREVQFSIRAPRIIPMERKVQETFPMRNYIFFDQGTDEIPDRYVSLMPEQASAFKEEQLLQPQPKDLTGRSRRQMMVYHNALNILGDRMRRYPNTNVTLIGSSEKGTAESEELAMTVKRYLMHRFFIEEERIVTKGNVKPPIPSVLPGATRELDLVVPEDRRVEISSSSPELLEPVQIISLQEDPLDSDVLFNVQNADEYFASWFVILTDENGKVTRFGPYTSRQERIPGKIILGEKMKGQYKVELEGQTSDGQIVKKEDSMKLIRSDEPEEAPGFRFSILFEFDQSKTVATYERFLTQTVVPLIPDGGSVIIHGHTDIVGEESHNLRLSQDRAHETMNVIEQALMKSGKTRVKFDTYGFGEDVRRAPFNNELPEERFYNRTVIIDIVPE